LLYHHSFLLIAPPVRQFATWCTTWFAGTLAIHPNNTMHLKVDKGGASQRYQPNWVTGFDLDLRDVKELKGGEEDANQGGRDDHCAGVHGCWLLVFYDEQKKGHASYGDGSGNKQHAVLKPIVCCESDRATVVFPSSTTRRKCLLDRLHERL
jgi:hypothetical protein